MLRSDRDCWKCHQKTWIFHAAVLNGGDADSLIEVTELMYWPDILTEIDNARAALNLPRMGIVKPRFSKTVGGTTFPKAAPIATLSQARFPCMRISSRSRRKAGYLENRASTTG